MEKEKFYELFLNDDYIKWLTNMVNKYDSIDDIYFAQRYKGLERKMLDYIKYLFLELNKYMVKNSKVYDNIFCYLLKYDDSIFEIIYDKECYSCKKRNKIYDNEIVIDYEDLIKKYKKDMNINFDLLKKRVEDSLENSDLGYIRYELSKLKEPTIFSGVGGSSVVSEFGSKVINSKNKIVTINSEPRDFIYRCNSGFKNVVACSYSGNNYGVELSFLKNLKKYLLSNNSFDDKEITYLKYNTTKGSENSFISLGATLIPVSILINYYLDGKNDEIIKCIENKEFNFDIKNQIYEIFSGYDTSTASKYLESTMIEAGIGIPIVHDKYSYCHGRSTTCMNYNSSVIYFNRNTELDKLLLEELKKYHHNIIVINSKYEDQILDDYQMLLQCMYLTKYIAKEKNKDLSNVKYNPIVKKLYKYHGDI